MNHVRDVLTKAFVGKVDTNINTGRQLTFGLGYGQGLVAFVFKKEIYDQALSERAA